MHFAVLSVLVHQTPSVRALLIVSTWLLLTHHIFIGFSISISPLSPSVCTSISRVCVCVCVCVCPVGFACWGGRCLETKVYWRAQVEKLSLGKVLASPKDIGIFCWETAKGGGGNVSCDFGGESCAIPPVGLGLSGRNSGKFPERHRKRSQSEFPSRIRLGCSKPYNSRHLRLSEHFQNSLPLITAGDAIFFRSGSGEGLSELVMEFLAVLRVFLKKALSSAPSKIIFGGLRKWVFPPIGLVCARSL